MHTKPYPPVATTAGRAVRLAPPLGTAEAATEPKGHYQAAVRAVIEVADAAVTRRAGR